MTLLIPAAFLACLSAATHWGFAPHSALLPLAAASLALAVSRRAVHTILAVALLAAALAVLRATVGTPPPSPLAQLIAEREITAVRGEVVDDPAPRERAQLVRLRVNAVRLAAGEWRVVNGTAQLVTRLVPTLQHGDYVEARGRIQPPEASNPPGYASYLRRQGIDAVAAFPFIEQRGERVTGDAGNNLYDRIVQLRRAAVSSLERLLPEPHAALAQGILLGRRATMPVELTEDLRLIGLSHMTAVSGFNLSLVIAGATGLVGLTPTRRRWRRLLGVALATALLWCFVALVGASGSVLRAAAMAQLALVGISLGRRGTAGGMLLWGSALLALWKPDVVTDVGWQLSFLGTAGLAWCAAPIERALTHTLSPLGRLAPLLSPLRGGLAATLAAQLFVFPVLASVFGAFSVVAPLSNVLALPLVPWIMLG
ncbi:MAG TPA: ComEC/Rec2 family competence protein, partial [Chloroflexota bacterium]|nr:ComEC/Rec2 family competence protein [Chloroflexota bacterium]